MNQIRTFWISLGIALFAVFLLYSYSQEKTQQLTKKFGAKTKILVATKDILEMQTVSDDLIEVIEVPKDFVQPGAFTEAEEVIGKVALVPIYQGEHILENKLMSPSPITGLSNQIQPGKRAFSIPVDQIRAISYLIRPGDRIDVLVASEDRDKKVVKTLLQSVSVLATGQNIANELPRILKDLNGKEFIQSIRREQNYQTITLELTPLEVQKITYFLYTSPSSLFFSLRHPTDDKGVISLGETDSNDLFKNRKRRPSSGGAASGGKINYDPSQARGR